MLRLTSKIFQHCLNQTTKLPQRTLSNIQNHLTSKLQDQNVAEITNLFGKLNNEDQLKHKLPAINENNSIIGNYNNVFGYITNYRQIYIDNPRHSIDAPGIYKSNEVIQAARLIVIRRRKMKKHKLRKLRKKMKFEWAKVRQRREMRKEKAFQAVLINQIKMSEKFNAEEYVEMKLKKANEIPIPRFWKGKRLPAFIIKEKLGIK